MELVEIDVVMCSVKMLFAVVGNSDNFDVKLVLQVLLAGTGPDSQTKLIAFFAE